MAREVAPDSMSVPGQVKQRSVLTPANIAAQAPQRRKVQGICSHPQIPEMPIGATINMQLNVAVEKPRGPGPRSSRWRPRYHLGRHTAARFVQGVGSELGLANGLSAHFLASGSCKGSNLSQKTHFISMRLVTLGVNTNLFPQCTQRLTRSMTNSLGCPSWVRWNYGSIVSIKRHWTKVLRVSKEELEMPSPRLATIDFRPKGACYPRR